jgi:triphosphatase
MPPSETELKLEIDPGALRALQGHPLLRRILRSGPRTHRLRSVYFDTKDRTFHRQGMELRIRRTGQEVASLQTLKAPMGKGAYQRLEWELEVPGGRADFSELFGRVASDVPPGFLGEVWGAGVSPVFHTEVRRTSWELGEGEWEVEAALDRGAIVAGPRREPLFELELELKRGGPEHLQALALELLEVVPFRLLWASKPSRGYQLASGVHPEPPRWRPPDLRPEAGVKDVLEGIGHACREHLLANQYFLRATDKAEAIHQLRVGARRLRSALRLFRRVLDPALIEPVEEDLRWLLAELGPVRDLHVLLSETLPPVRRARPEDGELERLQVEMEKRLTTRKDHAARVALSSRFTRLILRIGGWLEGRMLVGAEAGEGTASVGGKEFAREALHRLDRRVRRDGKKLDALSDKDRHRLRIRVKRLRYAADFLAPLFLEAQGRRGWLRSVRAVQARLGELQDLTVAEALLSDLPPGVRDPDGHRVAGIVIGWHLAHREERMAAAVQTFGEYRRRRRFWR